ncbi:LysR family transcriptional regulator [Sphingomonas sp. TF3]|uniref:LysR family transcriptional regulator n=1 Tax=Sphingomonas sp. TF3 TaxID=2495580 RepID=UPI00163C2DA6|nr:LysR family transcriptional regulator [Sphingomonas sp. TF3]
MIQSDVHQRADLVSFRQLKLFDSIGRLRSVRKASEECNLSQPAVTQALAKLEQQVCVRLVERRASGSYLNEFGEIFYKRAARFFEQVEHALIELGVPGGEEGARVILKRISRSQTRGLIAIIEHTSFALAAQSLALSQASLQRATRDLESNLRRSIFYRTATGIVITQAGLEFGRKIKLATQEIAWGIRELDAAQGSSASEIVIGAMPFGGSVLLASALDDFISAYPQVDVHILNENASVMLKSLRSGDVDFVIGLLPEKAEEDLTREAFARTPYSIVGRNRHPLLRKGKPTTDDLLAYDWVVGTVGSSRRACFDALFENRRGPHASIVTCAVPVVRRLLERSDRLTLMTSYELINSDDNLTAIPFDAINPVPSIGVTMRKDWLPTQLHTDFIEIVRRRMKLPVVRPHLKQAT